MMTKPTTQASKETPKQDANNDFHSKHRPRNFDQIIGHENAVARLRGQIESGKLRSAYLFVGPSSVGKTTLARCFAAEVNGKPVEFQQSDYRESNAADQRSIEDMRELIRLSKFKPSGKKRIFMIDEAQALLANNAAATCFEKGTRIKTDKGDIVAEELHARMVAGEVFHAPSYNHGLGMVELKKIVASRAMQSTEDSVRIQEAGMTSNHRVFTKEQGYQEAQLVNGLTGIKLEKE